jgi:hypothetical protein
MNEFDELGRDQFLAKYGYRHAKRYFVRRNGKLYDSKAIAGVAVGFQYSDRGPMLNSEFSGGEGSVVRRLEELGFELVDRGEDADDGALVLPQREVDAFVESMASEEYARDERDYKVAVHEVVSRLVAPETLERSEFPALGKMLFLGLGTGLGSALIVDGRHSASHGTPKGTWYPLSETA